MAKSDRDNISFVAIEFRRRPDSDFDEPSRLNTNAGMGEKLRDALWRIDSPILLSVTLTKNSRSGCDWLSIRMPVQAADAIKDPLLEFLVAQNWAYGDDESSWNCSEALLEILHKGEDAAREWLARKGRIIKRRPDTFADASAFM
jgi:hypothetical protein